MNIFNSLNNNRKLTITTIIFLLLTSLITINIFTTPIKACHSVGTYESDYTTPKTIFMQTQIVYGKETYTNDIHIRLRIRDPSNNVIFCSDPVYTKEIRISYPLEVDAPIGEWNIQVGLYNKGEWDWLTGIGDISYFYVEESLKYTLETYEKGSGTIFKNPDQELYINNTNVELNAKPDKGWEFDKWSGDLSGNTNPIIINMIENKIITAHFVAIKEPVSSSGGSSTGSGGSDGPRIIVHSPNIPPVASVEEILEGIIGIEITFDGSMSYDSDGFIKNWVWDFGDGTSDEGETVKHIYKNKGTYTVFLNVTDDDGARDTYDFTVILKEPNYSPTIPEIFGPTEAKEGLKYDYTILSIDKNNDLIKYNLNWGDGESEESDWLPSGEPFTVNHTWKTSGDFIVQIIADDDNSDTSSEMIVAVKKSDSNKSEFPLMLLFVILLIFGLLLFFIYRKTHINNKI